MSFADKVSWVGGMLGLFTGFSLISGFEILYWLWFKVVFHKDSSVEPETTIKVLEAGEENNADLYRMWKEQQLEIDDLKKQLKEMSSHIKHKHKH